MKTVYKYPVILSDTFTLSLPRGAEPLCVQMQKGVPCLWAAVETANTYVTRRFIVAGTGHPLPENVVLEYIGTFQMEGGSLVWHLFESFADDPEL